MTYRRIRFGQIGNSEVICFAVQELASYLKKMDAKLVVEVLQAESIQQEFTNIIWVGLDESLADKVPRVEDAMVDDAIVVSVEDGHGYITGANERSVLLAAYRFLKELGCNWVRPGWEGERIPTKPIENVCVHICETPSYRHRCVCIEGANTYENLKDMVDFIPKVGMNGYYVQFFVPEIFFKRWYLHEENPYLEKEEITEAEVDAMTTKLEAEVAKRDLCYYKYGHGWTCVPFNIEMDGWNKSDASKLPEEVKGYLAMRNGERGKFFLDVAIFTHLCYSNPIVRQKMVESVVNECKMNPQVKFINFSLADGVDNHCECEECKKKTPSDWYVILLNELDERMTAENIDTKVNFVLYSEFLYEPVEERIKNSKRFVLKFAPYHRKYGQNLSEAKFIETELPPRAWMIQDLDDLVYCLRRWQDNFDGDGFDFDYHLMWAHLNDLGMEACANNFYHDIRGLRRLKLNGMVNCQVQRSFFPTALPFNVMAATLWNENCDYEEQVARYYRAAFGEDGIQVHQYLKAISDIMLSYQNPGYMSKRKFQPPYCKDYAGVRKLVEDFLPIIKEHVETEQAPYQEEWKMLLIHSEYVTRLTAIMELHEQKKEEEVKERYAQLVDFLTRNEMETQKVLDTWNAIDHWRRFVAFVNA